MTTTPHAELLTPEDLSAAMEAADFTYEPTKFARAIERALLARLGEQQPVAWRIRYEDNAWGVTTHVGNADEVAHRPGRSVEPLYAHPPAAQPAIDAEALHAAIRALGTLTQRQAADVVRVVMEMTGGVK